jgi:hypothetical protein
MFEGIDLSPAARNRDLQIREVQRQAMPGVQEQVARQVIERENELLAGALNTALGVFRGRCRAAANKKDRAQAHAENLIAQVDQKIRDLKPSPGCSLEESTRRLGDMKLYLTKIDEGLPGILAEINQVATDQQREENLQAATARRISWGQDAERLKAHGCVAEIEKNGRRLQLRDGVLGVLGGNIDDRHRVFIGTWRDEIIRLVEEREVWRAIEPEQ